MKKLNLELEHPINIDILMDIFSNMEAEERRNFVSEICERYSCLVCHEIYKLNKCKYFNLLVNGNQK